MAVWLNIFFSSGLHSSAVSSAGHWYPGREDYKNDKINSDLYMTKEQLDALGDNHAMGGVLGVKATGNPLINYRENRSDHLAQFSSVGVPAPERVLEPSESET